MEFAGFSLPLSEESLDLDEESLVLLSFAFASLELLAAAPFFLLAFDPAMLVFMVV